RPEPPYRWFLDRDCGGCWWYTSGCQVATLAFLERTEQPNVFRETANDFHRFFTPGVQRRLWGLFVQICLVTFPKIMTRPLGSFVVKQILQCESAKELLIPLHLHLSSPYFG